MTELRNLPWAREPGHQSVLRATLDSRKLTEPLAVMNRAPAAWQLVKPAISPTLQWE